MELWIIWQMFKSEPTGQFADAGMPTFSITEFYLRGRRPRDPNGLGLIPMPWVSRRPSPAARGSLRPVVIERQPNHDHRADHDNQ
jgi:hypothetical protein